MRLHEAIGMAVAKCHGSKFDRVGFRCPSELNRFLDELSRGMGGAANKGTLICAAIVLLQETVEAEKKRAAVVEAQKDVTRRYHAAQNIGVRVPAASDDDLIA